MATLEDTFRLMKGQEPVNTDRISEFDNRVNETKKSFMRNTSGLPAGKMTKDFLDCIRNTIVEQRSNGKSSEITVTKEEGVHRTIHPDDGVVDAVVNMLRKPSP